MIWYIYVYTIYIYNIYIYTYCMGELNIFPALIGCNFTIFNQSWGYGYCRGKLWPTILAGVQWSRYHQTWAISPAVISCSRSFRDLGQVSISSNSSRFPWNMVIWHVSHLEMGTCHKKGQWLGPWKVGTWRFNQIYWRNQPINNRDLSNETPTLRP